MVGGHNKIAIKCSYTPCIYSGGKKSETTKENASILHALQIEYKIFNPINDIIGNNLIEKLNFYRQFT